MVKRRSWLASNEPVQVQLLVGVLDGPVVQWPGRPLDVGKIGGSSPPGTTVWLVVPRFIGAVFGRVSRPGNGNRLEAGRALTLPCGFNSRSFRSGSSPRW